MIHFIYSRLFPKKSNVANYCCQALPSSPHDRCGHPMPGTCISLTLACHHRRHIPPQVSTYTEQSDPSNQCDHHYRNQKIFLLKIVPQNQFLRNMRRPNMHSALLLRVMLLSTRVCTYYTRKQRPAKLY